MDDKNLLVDQFVLLALVGSFDLDITGSRWWRFAMLWMRGGIVAENITV